MQVVGVAQLREFALAWHKRSTDGSGKCDVIHQAGSTVIGAVYEVSDSKMDLLDEAEGAGKGYERIVVPVGLGDSTVHATSYQADEGYVESGLMPYDWYKDLVVAGARAHSLPDSYVEQIVGTSSRSDPRPLRAAKERAQLELSP